MSQDGNGEGTTVYYLQVKAPEQPLNLSIGHTSYALMCVGDALTVNHFEEIVGGTQAAALQEAVDAGYLMRFDTYDELKEEMTRRRYTYSGSQS
jgi:hypothetical protein